MNSSLIESGEVAFYRAANKELDRLVASINSRENRSEEKGGGGSSSIVTRRVEKLGRIRKRVTEVGLN